MMNYSELKDHEINAAVGEALGWNAKFIHQDDSVSFRDDKGRIKGTKNYCNSWADAGPIIQEYGIELGYDGIAWEASSNLRGIEPYSDWKNHPESPCRLAMIVFLMIQEQPDAE